MCILCQKVLRQSLYDRMEVIFECTQAGFYLLGGKLPPHCNYIIILFYNTPGHNVAITHTHEVKV